MWHTIMYLHSSVVLFEAELTGITDAKLENLHSSVVLFEVTSSGV